MHTIPTASRLIARTLALLIVALILLTAAVVAHAAPTLLADPYPSTAVQPDSARITANGGAPIACALETVAAGKQPRCDLAFLTGNGTWTLVLTVCKAGGITTVVNGATVTQEACASSAPFSFARVVPAVAAPTGLGLQP